MSLGSMYKKVEGTDYYSTNPSNPNAARYYADGSPVASVSHTNTSGQTTSGYVSPEQFQQIVNAPTAQAKNNYVEGLINSNSISTPQQNTGHINATGAGDHHKNVTTGQSWQDSLGIFATDRDAYNKELARVTGLINSGTAPDMAAAQDWLGKLQGINHQPVVQQGPNVLSSMGQTGQSSTQSYIDQLNNAKRDVTIAQLGKSRDQALSNLGQERAGVAPRYYDQRNQVSANNQQQSRNFAEFMASRGSTNAGSNAQASLMQSMALQGNLGTLGRQEQATYDDLDRRGSDVRNAYEHDITSAISGIEAQRMEALINQMNQDRQFGLQEAGLTGNYNSQRTLQGQQFDWGMNPNNPTNRLSEQQLNMGEYQLGELMNPNSVTNQLNNLALEASRLGNEQLRKQIEQIGRQPALTEYDRQMQSLQLEQAKVQLNNLKNQSNNQSSQGGLNQDEVRIYNNLMAEFQQQDPVQAYNFASSPQGQLNMQRAGLGEGLYNQMLNALQSRIPQQEKLGNKESADNYFEATNEIQNKLYSKGGITRSEAMAYAQGIRDHLSDADYKKLLDYISTNVYE